VGTLLQHKGLPLKHEATTIGYVLPASKHRYTPDFDVCGLTTSTIYLETKGRLTSGDRKKMKAIVAQHPEKLLVMLFSKPENKINKGSKTTYSAWADANDIRWCSLDDFEEDPKKCLLNSIRKKVGKSKTPAQRKSLPSKKSVSK
jgi:hypothetical protein